MSPAIPGTNHGSEELLALRHLIARLAPQCGLDIEDRLAIRGLLAGNPPLARGERVDLQKFQELRAMLILLFRLEGSSSEDLGFDGMRRLWHQHSETMARFQPTDPASSS